MHAAIRPYATGGIALVGASVIAVSPIAPPLPDIHLPNPAHVVASVELAAATLAATPPPTRRLFRKPLPMHKPC